MMCQSINQSFIDSNENKVVSNVPRTGETKQFSKTKKLKSVTFTISMNDGIPLANQPSNTCVYWRHPNLNDSYENKEKNRINEMHTVYQTMLQFSMRGEKNQGLIHSLSKQFRSNFFT